MSRKKAKPGNKLGCRWEHGSKCSAPSEVEHLCLAHWQQNHAEQAFNVFALNSTLKHRWDKKKIPFTLTIDKEGQTWVIDLKSGNKTKLPPGTRSVLTVKEVPGGTPDPTWQHDYYKLEWQ